MKLQFATALLISSITGSAALAIAPSHSASPVPGFLQELDMAMDGTTFFFEGATNENGAPANGTPFVVSGYLYPSDTFETYGELSGVAPDGGPEFPDLVLGSWTCRGWHLQDGDAATGPVVATTQIFDFNPGPAGRHTIITDGIELADLGVSFDRAITGATGRLATLDEALTICSQVYVGGDVNSTGGFNAEFRFAR